MVQLDVGPSPILRYFCSALALVSVSLLLYSFVFRHLDALAVQLEQRKTRAAEATCDPVAAAAARNGVQVFSAALRAKDVKRYVSGPGATRKKKAAQ